MLVIAFLFLNCKASPPIVIFNSYQIYLKHYGKRYN